MKHELSILRKPLYAADAGQPRPAEAAADAGHSADAAKSPAAERRAVGIRRTGGKKLDGRAQCGGGAVGFDGARGVSKTGKKKRHTYTVCLFSALRPSAIFLYAVRRRRFTPSTDTFMRNACSTQLRPRTSHSAIHCASSCGKSKDWIHAIALLGAMLCSIARISRCS